MVKNLTKLLIGVLISTCLAGYTFAQSPGEAETVNISTLSEKLRGDIVEYKLLIEELSRAAKMEHKALIFRRDERGLRLLANFDKLVDGLTNLPDGSPLRETTEPLLTEFSERIENALFNRINEIRQRIIDADSELGNLSGVSLTAAQAYIQSMEAIHVRYYQAFANHLESRNAMGLSSENLLNRLSPELHLYAETITGRIEASAATSREAQSLSKSDPVNADIKAVVENLGAIHDINVHRLETIISVLDRLGLDSSDYKAIMLQHSSKLSISFFSAQAVISVFNESVASVKSSFKKNAPDIFFGLLMFLAVLFVFRMLSRIIKRLVGAACERSSLNMSSLLKDILVSTSGGVVMAVGILMALSQVGISVAPMLAGLGVAGFVIGFALQDTLGNFAAGAMILIYRPFDVDDFVEVTGASGLVKKMNLVSTTIATYDNQILVVPNNKIWGDVIKNVTSQKVRRVDLEFGTGYGDDIEKTERILKDIISNHEMVLKKPEPMIKVHTLGDSSVNFIVRPWVQTEDYWNVYWDLTREVKIRFDQEGISIPFPQRDVHLYKEQA